MLYFGAIPLKPKSNSMDIVFAGNRWCFVSIVPRSSTIIVRFPSPQRRYSEASPRSRVPAGSPFENQRRPRTVRRTDQDVEQRRAWEQ